MEKSYLYFQPEYVGKFKCNGAKCAARCCKNWNIFVDGEIYQRYSQLPDAQEIIKHIKTKGENYSIKLTEKLFCPFLTENNLCRLQRDYGEDFLSKTCATYPRYTYNFGKFFERALVLTCPVAAEKVLFQEEPLKFEFVEVPEKIHSNGGKIAITKVKTDENLAKCMLETQVAMISILQERKLTITQRLIMLGFFLDKFDEMTAGKVFTESEAIILIDDLRNLVLTYESKKFLAEQMPLMLRIVSFDAKKFVELIFAKLFESFYGGEEARLSETGRKFMDMVVDVLQIKPDKNNNVSASEIAANYEKLAAARKNFSEKYSTFLENYLVNELFINIYPWRLEESFVKNYAVFVSTYKIFELIIFSATQKNFSSKENLLEIVDWFTLQNNHSVNFHKKILEHFKEADDIFPIMESLLEQ